MRHRLLFLVALGSFLSSPAFAAHGAAGRAEWCGTTRDGARAAGWAHVEERERRGTPLRAATASSSDVGQIAVLLDEGDLALLRNPMNLQGTGVRFSPAAAGYSASRIALPLEPATGTPLALTDDSSQPVTLSFAFPFFGQTYTQAFVNSDGNVTFIEKDDASTDRDIGRLVNGPPRIAPLLADFNVEKGGTISFQDLHDHATVTWTAVPQFDQTDTNTFQVTLWADGRVDFVYGAGVSTAIVAGAVGIAPGGAQGGLTAVNFATAAAVAGAGALAESFRSEDALDTVAVARKFYATHGDDYQQIIVFTSRSLVSSGTFSYEQTVHDTDSGIGDTQDDQSAVYGSAGRLESFVLMDTITKYPDDLNRRFLGEDSTLTVLAHEVGHRWLVNARFRDGATTSTDLLGRDLVHWSFFADTDGSYLEGNDLQDNGGGQFRTVGASLRYSALDQYLMGMRDVSEVPPTFVVRNPAGIANTDPGQKPQTGVTFSGARKDVAIGDIVAAIGERNPPGKPWTQPFREVFVYVSVGGPADPQNIAKVERIRAAWPAFFAQSTEGRGGVDPTLD